MTGFPQFNENHLEAIARVLGEAVTGTQLDNIFATTGIKDVSSESTKWKRIYHSLLMKQRHDRVGNNVAAFIGAVMSPGRFLNDKTGFDKRRRQLNEVLCFDGLQLDESGQFRTVEAATTISQAKERAGTLAARLEGRKIHLEALKYCREELLQDDYFHAVLEATKSLAQRIRDMTGLATDGSELVDEAFSVKAPLIALNDLRTQTERSEQAGVAMLLKGCFSAVRNPSAHEPRVLWKGEDDAADYLTLISLLHRKLDVAVVTANGNRRSGAS